MTTISEQHEIVITRTFNAPRELVWQAWTESTHIAKWWGPRGFDTRVETNELRVGGRSRYVMIGPDGAEYPAEGMIRELVPLEKIVSTDEFGEDYIEQSTTDLPQGMIITILFDDVGDKTKVTLNIAHPDAETKRKHEEMGVVDGWNSSLDCLEDHLATLN